MRELTTKEILTISGGNADSGYEGRGCASQYSDNLQRKPCPKILTES